MSPLAWAALAALVVVLTVLVVRRGDRTIRWIRDDMDTDDFLDAIARSRHAGIRSSVAPERTVVPPPARLRLVDER